MSQPTNPSKLSPDRMQEARIAGLIVIGLLLFVFEAYLPRPVPWLKFGLANIATLIALYWMGWREAVTVTVLRILIGAFFVGTLFTPGFFLSFSGGVMAVLVMSLLYRSGWFSLLAISITGALTHNLTQLVVATYWLFHNPILWYLTPYLLLSGVLTGAVIGVLSHQLLNRLYQVALPEPTGYPGKDKFSG